MTGTTQQGRDVVAGGLAASFAAEAGPIARFWPEELLRTDPQADAVDATRSADLTTAVAQALADDLAPLAGLAGLDERDGEPAEMTLRLDTLLRHLDAVRRIAVRRPALRMRHDAAEIEEAFATLARQLAIQATATLGARALAADERAASSGAALAITLHELRRPLTVLSSYSQLFQSGLLGALEERGENAVHSMVSASEVMMRLIEGLAAVARLEDPTEPASLRDVAIADVFADAVRDTETEAQLKGVAVTVDVTEGLRLRGDHERLTLATTNMLSNAVKHSPQGATVEVRGFSDAAGVHVLVRDHGPGFPPATAERLFEKYYRDAGERDKGIPGTGLGLFIVHTVAERHGGRAEARPAEGGGAEFELVLPGPRRRRAP